MRVNPDGTPKRNGLLQALEIDAVEILRNRKSTAVAMRDRLNARYYLLQQGWTVGQINDAQNGEES